MSDPHNAQATYVYSSMDTVHTAGIACSDQLLGISLVNLKQQYKSSSLAGSLAGRALVWLVFWLVFRLVFKLVFRYKRIIVSPYGQQIVTVSNARIQIRALCCDQISDS